MHALKEDLELCLLGSLTPERASFIEAHLAECPDCSSALTEAETFVQQMAQLSRRLADAGRKERRQEPRIATNERGVMTVIQPQTPGRVDVVILDTSKNGLKLRVPETLAPGTIVQVRLKSTIILGHVRYCVIRGDDFHAGIKIEDVFAPTEVRTGDL